MIEAPVRIEVMAFEWIGHLTSCERTSDFSGATTQQKGELVKRSVHGTGYRTLLTVRFLTAGAALLLAMLATSVQSALPANAVSPVTVRPLSGELTPVPVGDTLIGPASPSTKMSLEVTLQPRNPSALAAEVNAVTHRRLSVLPTLGLLPRFSSRSTDRRPQRLLV